MISDVLPCLYQISVCFYTKKIILHFLQFYCNTVGAKLVEIETASENDFLKKHLQSIGATSKQSFNQTYMLCQQEQDLFEKNPHH